MSINDYIKKIDSFDEETLKTISTRNRPAFRSYFKLLAVVLNKPRLSDKELDNLRHYIDEKLNPTEKVQQQSSQVSDSSFDGDTTDESSVDSSSNNLTYEIKRLSIEANKLLNILQSNCKRLQVHSSLDKELVAEFKDFIKYARQEIDEATNEPELSYSTVDKERCESLTRIIDQIKSNIDDVVTPIIESQPDIPRGFNKH